MGHSWAGRLTSIALWRALLLAAGSIAVPGPEDGPLARHRVVADEVDLRRQRRGAGRCLPLVLSQSPTLGRQKRSGGARVASLALLHLAKTPMSSGRRISGVVCCGLVVLLGKPALLTAAIAGRASRSKSPE